jgi:hypothetical protein
VFGTVIVWTFGRWSEVRWHRIPHEAQRPEEAAAVFGWLDPWTVWCSRRALQKLKCAFPTPPSAHVPLIST